MIDSAAMDLNKPAELTSSCIPSPELHELMPMPPPIAFPNDQRDKEVQALPCSIYVDIDVSSMISCLIMLSAIVFIIDLLLILFGIIFFSKSMLSDHEKDVEKVKDSPFDQAMKQHLEEFWSQQMTEIKNIQGSSHENIYWIQNKSLEKELYMT